jgi:hypothetical protein
MLLTEDTRVRLTFGLSLSSYSGEGISHANLIRMP